MTVKKPTKGRETAVASSPLKTNPEPEPKVETYESVTRVAVPQSNLNLEVDRKSSTPASRGYPALDLESTLRYYIARIKEARQLLQVVDNYAEMSLNQVESRLAPELIYVQIVDSLDPFQIISLLEDADRAIKDFR
jgi:hypothetical protein